jgi:hypothetical protein
MLNFGTTVLKPALISFLLFGAIAGATFAADLSRYRNFQLGTDLSTVAKQAGVDPDQAKVIQRRPGIIMELAWRPQPLAASAHTEPAKEVVFSFYNGELFQIAINYDRYETEGLTTNDFIDAISAFYGTAEPPTAPAKPALESYGDRDEILAQWQDADYRFELIRSSSGPSFRLMGVLKRLEAPVQAAILEAKRLDDKEAPQRAAEKVANDLETERVKLDKARMVNKPNFRP